MFAMSRSLSSIGGRRGAWRNGWQAVRDLLGGWLVLVVWVALWTSVWAAVAGPLSPVVHGRAPAAAEVADGG